MFPGAIGCVVHAGSGAVISSQSQTSDMKVVVEGREMMLLL